MHSVADVDAELAVPFTRKMLQFSTYWVQFVEVV
jgi:hypothetical protein